MRKASFFILGNERRSDFRSAPRSLSIVISSPGFTAQYVDRGDSARKKGQIGRLAATPFGVRPGAMAMRRPAGRRVAVKDVLQTALCTVSAMRYRACLIF